MKVDLYTKVILTVIALCLTVIVIRDIEFIPEARAQFSSRDEVVSVQIVGIDKAINRSWEALSVKIDR
ncbi:MAG: hypothetical protein HZA88_18735 [Verrucomicrobia bacterium]|nr:hypothetical protein [Verrucomicrobiota bacterium]